MRVIRYFDSSAKRKRLHNHLHKSDFFSFKRDIVLEKARERGIIVQNT